mgnify:CR=1 FL=1
MKIVFFGDSITDAGRNREWQDETDGVNGFGMGYVNAVVSELVLRDANKYVATNSGIGGNRVVDLYARIKKDCWNYNPDVISVLVGVNDVWHEINWKNGVELDRFEKIYRMLLQDTLKVLPNAKIMIIEPFILHGSSTNERYEELLVTREYAKVAKKLAEELKLPFVATQDKLDDFAAKFGERKVLVDGIHPAMLGARIIANEWLKVFDEKVDVE